MAKKWSNQNLPGALHYLTGNVVHRIPVFTQTACCEGFFDVLAKLLREWPCKLICYVLMPDHFHLILNPCDGNIKGFGAALKSLSAKKIVEPTGSSLHSEEARKGRNTSSSLAGEF